jgi:hypothetical protein
VRLREIQMYRLHGGLFHARYDKVMRSPNSRLRYVAATAVLLGIVLAYFSAYFVLGKRGTISGPILNGEAQFFSYNWQVMLFKPAANVESVVRGKKVHIEQWNVQR